MYGTSERKKILIIGANGFLGSNLLQLTTKRVLNKPHLNNIEFYAADIDNSFLNFDIPFLNIDITKPEQCIKQVSKIKPDCVILTAALTNVDLCETNKSLAAKINIEGPKNVVKACKTIMSKLIFMSTDFVFDGMSKEGNYTENDTPNPIGYYGKSKYEAEQLISNSEIEYLICRTSVLYGWSRNKLNFITWILNELKQGKKIKLVTDQKNNPTYSKNLAEMILFLVYKQARGIFHTVGSQTLNRYEMGLLCAEIFDFDLQLVSPIAFFEQVAQRPKNAGLNIDKLQRLVNNEFSIFSLKDGLLHMKEESKLADGPI